MWWRRIPPWWRQRIPKIHWKHDNWTLHRIRIRFTKDPQRYRILTVLVHLRAGISVQKTTEMLKESRTNIIGWMKKYQKEGLQTLLGLSFPVPPNFRKGIERYIRENPNILNQLLSLESEEDFDFYGEEIGVEGYALKNWISEYEMKGK